MLATLKAIFVTLAQYGGPCPMQTIQSLIDEKHATEIHDVHAFILDDLHSTNEDLAKTKLALFKYQLQAILAQDHDVVIRPDSTVITEYDNFLAKHAAPNETALLAQLVKPAIKGDAQIADTIVELLAVQVQKLKALDPGTEDLKTASFVTFADGQDYRHDIFIWSKQFSSPQIINAFGQTSALLIARSNISRTRSNHTAVDSNYMPLVELAYPNDAKTHQQHLQRCRMVMLSRNV